MSEMSEMEHPWLNHKEVDEVLAGIENKRTRSLVQFGITTALLRVGEIPSEPFDLRFFAKVLIQMLEQKTVLESIVCGDPDEFRWWSEE